MESATPRSAPIFRTPGQGLSFNDISDVDAEIARVNAYLVELRGIRNSMTLAIRVPPEILGQIFLDIKSRERHKCISSSYHIGSPSPKQLVAVTRVCRAWRVAALTYPALWTFVSIHYSPIIARWMISHSASHGITFHGYYDVDPDRRLRETTTSDVVLEHLPRIAEMLLEFNRRGLDSDSEESDDDDPYGERNWEKRDRAEASYEGDTAIGLISDHRGPSMLRILSITNGYNLAFSETPMPCLRFLRYVNVRDLSPDTLPLSLVLQSISLKSCSIPSLVDFLGDICTKYPNLKSLIMEYCTTQDPTHVAIALPQLTLLRITGNEHDVSRIASGIRISQGCKLHIVLHTGALRAPFVDGLTSLIFERADDDVFLAHSAYFDIHSEHLYIVLHTEAPPLRSLLAQKHTRHSSDSDDLLGKPLYDAPVVMEFPRHELYRRDAAWLACYRAVVPLDKLDTVAVHWNRASFPVYRRSWQPTIIWGELLAGMTHLRSLRTNQDIDGVLSALYAAPPVGSTEHVLVPSLQRLVLDDVTAGRHILGKIECALGQRKANGATMDSVAISLWDDGEQRGHVELAKMIEEHGEVEGVPLIYRVDSSADLSNSRDGMQW